MGRCFSTAYRIVLVIASLAALVMSIMSATSCAFVKFDHQYGSQRRSLQDGDDQDGTLGVAGVTENLGMPGSALPGVADPADDPAYFPDAAGDAAAAAPAGVDPADVDAAVAAGIDPPAATAAEGDAAAADPAATATEGDGDAFAAAIDTANAALDSATSAAGDALAATIDPTATVAPGGETLPVDVDPADEAPPSDPADYGVDFSDPAVIQPPSDEGELAQGEFPWAELNEEGTTEGTSEDGSTSEDMNTLSGAGEASQSSFAASEESVAQVSGDAGLFCDGQKSFSVTNLWGGTIAEFEEEIAEESDKNQSEELARNAVIAAAVFGSFAAVIVLIESVIGWRMWCERWIVGIVSAMACVSQGITFLFFNSERYCDGDIVHEIINQEPCVVGQGGVYSIIALVLYFVMIVMSCRLPQDDPYGLCCKKNDPAKDSTASTGGSGKFGLLGSGSKGEETFKGSSGGKDDDPRRERPNWLSEDARKEAVEGGEDEII